MKIIDSFINHRINGAFITHPTKISCVIRPTTSCRVHP